MNGNTSPDLRGELPKWISCHLSTSDALKIEAAVAAAEVKTTGEIVPVIVRRSVNLKPPAMKLSALFILLYCLFVETRLGFFIDTQEMLALGFGFIVAASLGPILVRSQRVRRLLMPNCNASQLAKLRAEVEFYRAGIGGTSAETGILLFIALEDHQAVVLADKAISSLLPAETWDGILATMLKGLKNRNCSKGMIEAITQCGDLLATHFPIQKGDVNELPNQLRIIE
jgi:putative membrane protein